MNALVSLPLAAAVRGARAGFTAHPNAELIDLGMKHEALAAEVAAIDAFVNPIADAIDNELRSSRKSYPRDGTIAAERERRWDEAGITLPYDRLCDLIEQSDPLSRRIMKMQARTLVGIAVQARCAGFSQLQLWNEPLDDLDWQKKLNRSLIENACAAAGFPPPNEPMTQQQFLRAVNSEPSAIAA